ncbi:MAG: uroporphyrinogen decarboxylase family protein [Candidatus Bathyarchaeia archaeon]
MAKLERINKALHHEEPDRVPVSDFFWSSFIKRWRRELNLSEDIDIYRYYDLDWVVTYPNMDPHIRQFEIIKKTSEEVIVKTGFDAVIRKKFSDPMPAFLEFQVDAIEKAEKFEYDDPWDKRRYFAGGDNQIAGIGDTFERNLPPWIETVKSLRQFFPVYGSVCEANEILTRLVGKRNMLLWIARYPEKFGRVIEKANDFALGITSAQIDAAEGLLDGMVIWGDFAYTRDMFYSPNYWRRYCKPGVKAIIDVCHKHDLPVIYHGCGNISRVIGDLIEIGVDAINPLEAKAGLDVIELRRKYGHKIAFCGNMNVIEWATKSLDELKAIVLRKLNAAKGGGFIFQSDHSVSSDISGWRYDYVINLIREFGKYPLSLGEYDLSL